MIRLYGMRGGKLVLVIACLIASATPVEARGRLIRMLDARQGLKVPGVMSLAQDTRGFLWIGSIGGLLRYDGQELRRIAAATIATQVAELRAAPDGSLYVLDSPGTVFRVADEAATVVAGPDGKPLAEIEDVWIEPNGSLWVVANDTIRRRDAAGRWDEPLGHLASPRIVRGGGGALYVASSKQVWRVDGAHAVVVAHADRIIDVLPATDGSLYVLESHGHLSRVVGDAMTEVFYLDSRATTLVQRGQVIWVIFDSALVAIEPTGPPEIIRAADGFTSIGPLLVDTEGSLWLGTYSGVQQYPEPDTAIWGLADGVPANPRFLVETEEGIWTPSWTGLGRIDVAHGKAADTGMNVRGGMCVDGQGRLWGADERGFVVRIAGEFASYPQVGAIQNPCDTGPSGRAWFAFRDGVYATRATGAPEHVAGLPAGVDIIETVHEDRHGRVWVSDRDLVCAAKLDEPIVPTSWQCQRIAAAVSVTDYEETEAGTLWAATEQAGVWAWNEAATRWDQVPGSRSLASRAIMGLAPSPRGGTWILGHGIVLRVRERADRADGWEVLESPSSWHGLPAVDAMDALETRDGTLWIAGFGVYQVPASVRGLVPLPPRMSLTDVRVDGVRSDPARVLELPYGENLLQLAFAALSYRDPALLRYRVRLASDEPWAELARPALQLAETGAGKHVAEISASLDGIAWSPPTVLAFEVRGPWWRRPWVIAAFAIGFLGIGYAIYRIRVALQLRLERQRVHIAMDLHDEMGSGLGSIGILAALATNTELPESKRRGVAAEIIDAAEGLGESLGDIVWSLRRGSNTLDALVAHILERGARLLPDGIVTLTTDLPSPVPAVPMSLVVCRSLQLVCFEALHNAARHAQAQNVTFGLARVDRRHWRFWVDDDGIGLAREAGTPRGSSSGLGLTSMRARAQAIGAELRIGTRSEGGTRVEVVFALGTPDRALRRIWRR